MFFFVDIVDRDTSLPTYCTYKLEKHPKELETRAIGTVVLQHLQLPSSLCLSLILMTRFRLLEMNIPIT